MGKKGAGTGVNTKVQAAREKQAVVNGARAAKERAAEEAAAAKEWSKGSNERGSKRESDAARKQDEKAAKAAAKKALEAEEAEQLAGFKSVVKTKKKVEIPPWEAALVSSSMSNKEKKKQEAAKREVQAEEARKLKAEKAAREAKAMRDSGIQMVDDGTDLTEGSANPNRKNGADGEGQWASGIDAAIGSLSLKGGRGGGGGGAEEKHPEKRLKAALAAYEEMELPALREEKPGLKLRQYKQMIFEKFQKAPENPMNRARAAEAEAAAAAGAKK